MAQELSTDVWHLGYVINTEEEKLTGYVKYNLETNVVQFSDRQGKNEAFNPKNLVYFEINDQIRQRTRRFYSLPYEHVIGYEGFTLFEVLVEGDLILLSREKRLFVNKSDFYWGVYYTYGQEVLQPSYFLLKADQSERITDFDGSRRGFIDYIGRGYEDVLMSYIKKNRLKLNDAVDLIRIVNYYNKLQK